jgi:hypothetical protein
MAQVGDLLGWPAWKAKRWLQCSGAAVKRGRYWYTTDRLLKLHFPEAFHEAALDDVL